MDAQEWDIRYGGKELVWGREPNRWVAEVCAGLTPGRALDLGCGEGRNAIWLAARGWDTTGVDFSAVALERAAQLGSEGPAGAAVTERTTWVCADLFSFEPKPLAFDLVLISYIQVQAEQRRALIRRAGDAVAVGGRLMVVAHDSANLSHGHGGPQDPANLYTADDVLADLVEPDGAGGGPGSASAFEVLRADRVSRPVPTPEGPRDALDALVVLRRN